MCFHWQKLVLILAAGGLTLASPLLVFASVGEATAPGLAFVLSNPFGQTASVTATMAGVNEAYPFSTRLGVFVTLEKPEEISRLYEHGALFILEGKELMKLCAI